jgi:molybdenum cofactor cytidylyltransferase
MKLQQALDIVRGDVVAFIGAGGKTSTLMNLGYELAEAGWRVMATTTTYIDADQLNLAPCSVQVRAGTEALSKALNEHRFAFLYDVFRNGRVYGPSPDYIPRLLDSVDSDVLLIEADKAEGMLLKAPTAGEPVIPPETSLVVPVASLSVLDYDLDDEHVYNVKGIVERYGFPEGARMKSPWVAQVMRDDELGLRGVPEKARVMALLNGTPEKGYLRGRARLIAKLILRSKRVQGVAIGSVRGAGAIYEVQRSVGAVVLAAGLSTRMGQHKIVMPWDGRRTIIEQIVEQLILARVDHIAVVTGYQATDVKRLVERQGVEAVYNAKYQSGEMLSSLKAGLKAMPAHISAALIVLGDQPRIQPRVVNQVAMAYAEGENKIVAPSYQMRRGHPILIDRRLWPEILDLPDNGSLRSVMAAHRDQIGYVSVDTDSILRDVDTPEDYRQERGRAGLSQL